jgi:hypothetical protein
VLVRRHREERKRMTEHQEFLFAQLTAMVANTSFRGFKELRRPDEFMPSQRRAVKPKRRRRAVIAEEARAVMRHFMGRR